MTTLLVLGNDKICRTLVRNNRPNAQLVIDSSSADLGRVLRLIRKGAIKPLDMFKIALAEAKRPDAPPFEAGRVESSDQLLKQVKANPPDKIVLFRAGLIVKRSLIETGIPIWNIHAARIPDYGGLASIPRALRDGSLDQCATLHVVTERIDDGEVIDTEPYKLDRSKSYAANEAVAYAAGVKLLERTISAA